MVRLVEVSILAVALWPCLRLGLNASFRRDFPPLAVTLIALAGLSGVGIAALVFLAPWLLHVVTALAVAAAVVLLWRARPAYGRRRGWPPGALTVVSSDALVNPDFYSEQAARYGPVFKIDGALRRTGMSLPLRPMVCVVGLGRGRTLLSDHADRLAPPAAAFHRFIPGGFLRYMEPTLHHEYRRIFRAVFLPRLIQTHEPELAALTRRELAALAEQCALASEQGILPRPTLTHLVFTLWARLFYGLTPDDDAFNRLAALSVTLDKPNTGGLLADVGPALADTVGLVRDQLAVLAAQSADTPCFLAQLAHIYPKTADDATALGNLIYTFSNSLHDVSALLVWALQMLGDNPTWIDALRAEVDTIHGAAPPGGLADRIIMETLRLEQSEYLTRRVLAPVSIGAWTIPRGWLIRVCVRESHRDPAVFAAPLTFNPDRFRERTYTRDEYSPFGTGSHACLGSLLTQIVGRLFLTELARGFDWRVVADGPREFGRLHWQPSRHFRITLRPRLLDE